MHPGARRLARRHTARSDPPPAAPTSLGPHVALDRQRDEVMRILITDAIEVVVTRLVAGRDAVCAATALLSDAERHRASRFACDRPRRRFIVGRGRLRQLLAARLGVQPRAVEFVYRARGKPALGARFANSGLRFNVAHCDDVAVYAFSRGREMGIDLEAVRVIPGADAVAVRFFSRWEREAYQALDARARPLGFVNCWTRKAAFIKALGDGLYFPLDRFDVSLAPAEPARLLPAEARAGDRGRSATERSSPT